VWQFELPEEVTMFGQLLRNQIRRYAMRTGRVRSLYVRFCSPGGEEWAEFMRRHGGLAQMGRYCSMLTGTLITDPALTSIGDNVHFSDCALIAHDGSVAMFARAYGSRVDAVGKIVIHDNVFIGFQAIVLRDVMVGPNAIVAAGAVVTNDVAEGDIVAGVPARPIGRVADYVAKLDRETAVLPWSEIIRRRADGHDSRFEPQLAAMRRTHYFGPP
jgi:acetyltransferase-like isoleucine patch superfamily enzyme